MSSSTLSKWGIRGAIAGAAIALAGCTNPYNPGQRALGGGAIGAGTGAIIGAAAGSPATGALIGGALGAGAGALTTPERPRYGGYDRGYRGGYDRGYRGDDDGYDAPPPRY